jgi:hypothetical protein
LRRYATSRKVAGEILDKVTGILNSTTPSCSIMAMGSILSRTEMSTRNVPEGKELPGLRAEYL